MKGNLRLVWASLGFVVFSLMLYALAYWKLYRTGTAFRWFPDLVVRHESRIDAFFKPVSAIEDWRIRRQLTKLWESRVGRWKAIYPEGSSAEMVIKIDEEKGFRVYPIEFPYVEDGDLVWLDERGGIVFGTQFTVELFPISEDLYVQVKGSPEDSAIGMYEFAFERE